MGAFEEILNLKRAIEMANQQPQVRTDCPECGWTLNKHPKTGAYHCVLCGYPYSRTEQYL